MQHSPTTNATNRPPSPSQGATNPAILLYRTGRTGAPLIKLEDSLVQHRFGPEAKTRKGIIIVHVNI